MWSLRQSAYLSLCLLAALVDAASVSVSGLSCASSDNGGGRLDNTFIDSSINGVHFDLLCTYFDGAFCAYSSDGSFNAGQSTDPDNVCPGSQAAATPSSTHSTPSQTETPQKPSHPLTPSSVTDTSTTSTTSPTDTSTPPPSQKPSAKSESSSPSQSTTTTTSPGPSNTPEGTSRENSSNTSSSQLLSPTIAPGGSTNSDRNRNKTRTAAIAASVISAFLLAGLLFLVLWLKRRRRRILHDKLLEPYTNDREEGAPSSSNGVVHPHPLPTVQKPSAGSSSASQSTPVEPQSAALLTDIRDRADADRHPTSTHMPGPDILATEEKSRDTPSAGASSELNFTPVDQQPESTVAPGSTTDDGTPREATLALRLRVQRMEAQLQAILTMGMAEGAPPSYTG